MKGWGLVVGWGGCECDGLVSNTLSLSMSATSTHPSMVSHSAVCFKAIVLLPLQSVCWCCCVVPLFAICPIPFSLTLSLHCYSQSNLWASARVPTGSMPATQSQKREVGTIALWPHVRVC